MKKPLLLFFAALISLISTAQSDTSFWFAAPEVSSAFNYDRPIMLRLTAYQQSATVTISQPANGGLPIQNVTILPNTTQSVNLSAWINTIECSPGNVIQNRGIKITSDNKIAAYYEVNVNGPNPELFALKGKNALGTEFYISSQNILSNSPVISPLPYSSFNIVATENNTSVTITPSRNIVGHAANVPFVITLNRGQTYAAIASSQSAAQHLQGSHVSSSKPIAITLSDDLLQGVAFGGTCEDLAGDQTVPVNIIGSEYIAVKSNLNSPFDKVYITSTQNGTSISQDGIFVTTLNAGSSTELTVTNSSTYIQSTAPVYVYHLSGIGCEVGSALLPKINCTGSSSVSVARSTNESFIITLLVKNGAQNSFFVNGTSGVVTAAQFTVVPATGGLWYAAKVSLPLSNYPNGSVITVSNTSNIFQMGIFQGGVLSGVGVGYFSDYNSLQAHASTTTATLCPGNTIQLSAELISSAIYSWTGPGGFSSNVQNPAINNATIINSGLYHLTVTVPGCGTYIDSVNITVNPCPNPISNIINTYTPVLALNPCNNLITVEDASTFNAGDTVLIIQMKGAAIDVSNTASFGTITDYKNSGNYEFNFVKSKSGNIVELKNNLTRQYDIPLGKVQLIRVPYYTSATITSTLTCLPWDGSKGGVLVLNARDNVDLAANIDVTGKGFFGGNSPNPNTTTSYCNNNNFYYAKGNLAAASKGEGIAVVSDTHAWGKGSPANGGGGGNGHNSGGGGGGNGGPGGLGGYQLEACGSAPFDNRGLGGKSLNYNNISNRIFMGGGGGSGHTDNAGGSGMPGGNGGGIIIITTPVIHNAGFQIKANGANGNTCSLNPITLCHDGSGGGGAGGTVLIENTNINGNTTVDANGGKGGDLVIFNNAAGAGKIGPGGGGGGGVVWSDKISLPANVTVSKNGGINGVIIQNSNDPWGATTGQAGINLFNLKIPYDVTVFKTNIDSVKIKDSAISCTAFDFKGYGYTNTNPIVSWQWNFGDGASANTQNISHDYSIAGQYQVKLIVTDINGCKDSTILTITSNSIAFDFTYKQDICNPLSVQFFGTGPIPSGAYWDLGDGVILRGNIPLHVYRAPGNYIVRYSIPGACSDTISKTISIKVLSDDMIITKDTSICAGSAIKLLSVPSLNFCWTPQTYLDSPGIANPTTSTPLPITYYLNAEVTGSNLVVNGDFNNGNSGFSSGLTYSNSNTAVSQYFVGNNPQAWNTSFSNCKDHTTAGGNMLLVNNAPATDTEIWKQSVTVTPNTNYSFSTWIQSFGQLNPAKLQFAINGSAVGNLNFINSTFPECTWTQNYITWNSGNNVTVTLSILNKNTTPPGNTFALDDISFAPVFFKRDSVIISIDKPQVKTNNDTTVCTGSKVQLNTTGAISYNWTPVTGLSNTAIANPVVTINNTSTYIVTGTSASNCIAKDTVMITAYPKPVIIITNDTVVCKNGSVQLFASGGISYLWSPSTGLSNPNISSPIASPSINTTYFVTITDANTCTHSDSVALTIRSLPVFSVSPDQSVCAKDPKQLYASGGTSYLWQPSTYLNNPSISNPVATPGITTTYTVNIKDNTCNDSVQLTTTLSVLPLPAIKASKSNDLDCSNGSSQLNATGGTKYLWQPGNNLNNNTISNPVATPQNSTLYTVVGIDVDGCKNSDTVSVNVGTGGTGGYYMPNAFSPNYDGINDCFGLKYWGTVTKLNFSIYNRFGERIFYTTDGAKCWDGKYKGVQQGVGVYVYVIKATTICDTVDKKGTFVLIR